MTEKEQKLLNYITRAVDDDLEDATMCCPRDKVIKYSFDDVIEYNILDEVLKLFEDNRDFSYQDLEHHILKYTPKLEIIDNEEYFKLYGRYDEDEE